MISLVLLCRDDFSAEEYADTKKDTLDQLSEFSESLNRMKEGNMSLVDELNRIQLVSHSHWTAVVRAAPAVVVLVVLLSSPCCSGISSITFKMFLNWSKLNSKKNLIGIFWGVLLHAFI